MRTSYVSSPFLLSLSLLVLASCEHAQRAPTSLNVSLNSGGGEEEELIGDTLWGTGTYYQPTQGGQRASYLIVLTDGAARDSMYYVEADHHQWGWYTRKEPLNCDSVEGSPREKHDTNGDTFADSIVFGRTVYERHCLWNGQYTLQLKRVVWDSTGTAIVADTLLFSRRVALLDYLGSYVNDPSSTSFHDVRVTFDRNTPEGLEFTGDLRAGDYYLGETSGQLYPSRTAFTISEGDTLWFQSTYVGTGPYPRPWYGSTRAILTQFNFDYQQHPGTFPGGVNSSPDAEVSPALKTFSFRPAEAYRVVGRVVAPHDTSMEVGELELGASIYVTTVELSACFSVTGFRVTGQLLTFDGHCSSGADTLAYRWTFGDGGGVDWPADSVVVHHAYAAAGSYPATLWVRRAGTTAPVDSTTQTLSIAGPLWVHLDGYDHIATSGTYAWTSQPHEGAPPYYPFAWYYQEEGSGETLVYNGATYRRYVTVRWPPYAFRLRTTVQDAIPTSAEDTLWVDVAPEGDGFAGLGLLDATGGCRLLPADPRARQAAHAAIARTGRWPVPCVVSVR